MANLFDGRKLSVMKRDRTIKMYESMWREATGVEEAVLDEELIRFADIILGVRRQLPTVHNNGGLLKPVGWMYQVPNHPTTYCEERLGATEIAKETPLFDANTVHDMLAELQQLQRPLYSWEVDAIISKYIGASE